MTTFMAQRGEMPYSSESLHRAEAILAWRPSGITADLVSICGSKECGSAWHVMITHHHDSYHIAYTSSTYIQLQITNSSRWGYLPFKCHKQSPTVNAHTSIDDEV